MQATERRSRDIRGGRGWSGNGEESWDGDHKDKEMGSSRGSGWSSPRSSQKRPYALLLLLAVAAAALSVVVVNKLREKRVLGILLQEREQELLQLQTVLEKEKEISKELRSSTEELKSNFKTLNEQKMELDSRLMEAEASISYFKEKQREMELVHGESQDRIKVLTEKESELLNVTLEVDALKERLKVEEEKVEEMKRTVMPDNATAPEIGTPSMEGIPNERDGNGTVDEYSEVKGGGLSQQQPGSAESPSKDSNDTTTTENQPQETEPHIETFKGGDVQVGGDQNQEGGIPTKGDQSDTSGEESRDRMLNQDGQENNSPANDQTIQQEGAGNREATKSLRLEEVRGTNDDSERKKMENKIEVSTVDGEREAQSPKMRVRSVRDSKPKRRRRRATLRGRRSSRIADVQTQRGGEGFSSNEKKEDSPYLGSARVDGDNQEGGDSKTHETTEAVETKTEMAEAHPVDKSSTASDVVQNVSLSNENTGDDDSKNDVHTEVNNARNEDGDSYEEAFNKDAEEISSNTSLPETVLADFTSEVGNQIEETGIEQD